MTGQQRRDFFSAANHGDTFCLSRTAGTATGRSASPAGRGPAARWSNGGPGGGTWLSSDALISFGWPASSDTLVAELSFTTKVQLTSWRPGASRLAIAVLRPQQSPASLVIGQYAP